MRQPLGSSSVKREVGRCYKITPVVKDYSGGVQELASDEDVVSSKGEAVLGGPGVYAVRTITYCGHDASLI